MRTFILHFVFNTNLPYRTLTVRGETVADAIRGSELDPRYYHHIDSYEVDGVTHEIASQANCGCWYHAEDGLSCTHDLAKIGLEPAVTV